MGNFDVVIFRMFVTLARPFAWRPGHGQGSEVGNTGATDVSFLIKSPEACVAVAGLRQH